VLLLPTTINSNHVNAINQCSRNYILVFTQGAFHFSDFDLRWIFWHTSVQTPSPVKFSLKASVQRKQISSSWTQVWAGRLREGQTWHNYQSLFVTVWKSLKMFLLCNNYIKYADLLCLQNEDFYWQHIWNVLQPECRKGLRKAHFLFK
jgi:hypothetical protein